MEKMNDKWKRIDYIKISPAIIIGIIIIYFSSLPRPLPPLLAGGFPIALDINTILHMCEFAGFTFLIAFGFLDKVKGMYLISFAILFAFMDEIHQYFVPNRYFDVYDIFIDVIGVVLGFSSYLFLIYVIGRIKRKDTNNLTLLEK